MFSLQSSIYNKYNNAAISRNVSKGVSRPAATFFCIVSWFSCVVVETYYTSRNISWRTMTTSAKLIEDALSPSKEDLNKNNTFRKKDFDLVSGKFFNFCDYDCIGFDLDNTICRYKVGNMVKMEYKALSDFLIETKGYSPKYLRQPIEGNCDFLMKGLALDVKQGNILKIAPNGTILHGSHGTKELSQDDLIKQYGPDLQWELTNKFISDPLSTWNGPHSFEMRILLDYFDMPVSLVFARAVDTLDEEQSDIKEYSVYADITDALNDMFHRDHFQETKGGYFPNILKDPDNYIHKCSDNLLHWFKELRRENKILYLVTGSNVDFASYTATQSLGANWRDLFDIVICFAKKPGFFTQKRPFMAVEGFTETHELPEDSLELGKIYTHGNWPELHKFLKKISKKENPKTLYIGDNLVQDVYTPSKHTECDTVTICEEIQAEGVFGHEKDHYDDNFLVSNRWGSYFHHLDESTIWKEFIKTHAKLAVPSLEYVAKFPINHSFPGYNI